MILDLTRLVHGRLDGSFRVAPDSPVFEGLAGEIGEPFGLVATLRQSGADTYVLDAQLHGTVARLCRRCLRPVDLDVDDRFRVVYQIADRDDDTDENGLVLLPPGTTRIDLTGPVRDRLFLGIPQYPLCREDCAGICPICGTDLNEGTCSCETEEGESAWIEALQAVRERVQESG